MNIDAIRQTPEYAALLIKEKELAKTRVLQPLPSMSPVFVQAPRSVSAHEIRELAQATAEAQSNGILKFAFWAAVGFLIFVHPAAALALAVGGCFLMKD